MCFHHLITLLVGKITCSAYCNVMFEYSEKVHDDLNYSCRDHGHLLTEYSDEDFDYPVVIAVAY